MPLAPTRRHSSRCRTELGIGPDTLLVGLVARYSLEKDPLNFLRAVAILKDRCPGVHFVLCGTQMDEANAKLVSVVETYGLRGRCHLLGTRRDMPPHLTASLDLAVQSSITEAFPLAMGEALACGVPCVATDVGDSAAIIGESGRIVPPRPAGPGRSLPGAARAVPGGEGSNGPVGPPPHPRALRAGEHGPALGALYETLHAGAHTSGVPSSAGCGPSGRGKVNGPYPSTEPQEEPRWKSAYIVFLDSSQMSRPPHRDHRPGLPQPSPSSTAPIRPGAAHPAC